MNNPDVNKTAKYFESIFTVANDGIVIVDQDCIILRVNPTFTKILGYEENEVLGKPFYILTSKNKVKQENSSHAPLYRFYAAEKSSMEYRFFDKTGQAVPIRFRSFIIRDEQGQVAEAVGIIEQIVELTATDESGSSLTAKMWEAQQNFENVLENSADAVLICDNSGNITMANNTFLWMLNYTQEEVIGKFIVNFTAVVEGTYVTTTGEEIIIDEECVKNTGVKSAELFEEGYIKNWETYFVRKDKVHVPVEATLSVLKDKDGERRGSIVILRDISERRRAERENEKSREFLENIFKTTADGIMVTDNQGCIVSVNKAIEQMLGFREDELVEKYTFELGTQNEECRKVGEVKLNQLFGKGYVKNWETLWYRKDETLCPVEINITCLKDQKGNISGSVGVIRDITERKKYEETLKKSEKKYQNLIENANDAVISINREGKIVTLNKKAEEMYGYPREELLEKSVILLVPPHRREGQKKALEHLRKIPKEEGFTRTLEAIAFGKDGKEFPVETSMFGSEINGEYILTSFVRDITERKKTDKELKETKDFLENIIENSRDGILVVDAMGNILSCNASIEQMSGFGKEKIIGEHASVLIIDDKATRQKILEKTAELFEKGFATYDAKYKSNDGKYLDVECTSSMISNEKGEYIAGVSIIRDISERKKAEHEIREGKEFLENIIKGSKDGILIGDEGGYILSANEAMEEMMGLSKDEIVGKHSSELLLDDTSEREKVIEKMGELFNKGFSSYETRYKSKNGDYVEVECYLSLIKDEKGDYIAGVSIIRDITERKKMQQQLLQSEKLRSLGELAGGVAHDFNNVLAAILGRAQLLKMQFKPPPGKQEKRKSMLDLIRSLEIIERASSDGAETVRRIQEFARKRSDDKDFTQVNINELLENVLEFTGVRWKDDAESKGIKITIQKEFSSLTSTLGSAAELREVFTNIINNALDAMPQGGRIQIKTLNENNHISIRIKDTGVGIPEDIRNRIFDPFFTTKGVQSTGLGMSTSYGIINRHQGTIVVDSVEGEGTTFTIKLPIIEGSIGKNETMATIPRGQRKARILVVDDEDEVRQLLSDILTSEKHDVDIASDGAQAVELFKRNDFDMVFADLGMPGMSGWEVAKVIKGINRKVPVAIITGWNVEISESEMRDKWVDFIIQKPFEVSQVFKLVQDSIILRDRFKAA